MIIQDICHEFKIAGEMVNCKVINSGHINNTTKVTFRERDSEESYIVQQINTYVFKDPVAMMRNISRVTSHIAGKLSEDKDRKVLEFLETKNGELCFCDDEGKWWRAYRFVKDSVTFDACDDLEILEQAGAAFGNFQLQLSDFNAEELVETIPDFHETEKRLNTLFSHVEEDLFGRAREVEKEVLFFRENLDRALKLIRMLRKGELPLRVTHNDTKCNNVLFDPQTKKSLAVIDLDTVMPGLAPYDFGDAIRFSATTAEEDEPDASKMKLDNDKFRAFAKGFIETAGSIMTETEKNSLVDGVIVLAMEIGSRFLDDYITGDKYFRTDYPGHNLVRARTQIALAKDVIARYDEVKEIIKTLL